MGKSEILKKAINKLDDAIKLGHDVVEVTPNTTTSATKKQIYQFGGAAGEIAAQVSSFMANYEYTQSLFGINPSDFEKWAEEFEECFPKAPITKKNAIFGDAQNPWWGKARDNRPKIKILNAVGTDLNYIWAEFYPDWDNKEECYFVTGTPFMCVFQIMNIWNYKEVILKGDFYQLLGYPPSEYLAKRPTQGLSVTFVLYNYKLPPYRVTDKRPDFKVAEMSVPYVRRNALTFENIKAAFGGNNGIIWGDASCRAWVTDNPDIAPNSNKKGLTQVVARGNNYSSAKSTLKTILAFTDAKIVAMSENKADKDEDLNPHNNKSTNNKFYLHHFFILNSKLLDFNSTRGRNTRLGKLNTKKNKIIMIDDIKPPGFDRQIDELFKWS